MKTFSQVPIYNLKVVINETGIKADALRVWERRYGLPAPTRTAGGQRLYSRYDIEMIRWLMSRQLEGWRISQVVVQWQKMISGGVDPLGETAEGTLQPTPIPVVSSSMLDEPSSTITFCTSGASPAAINPVPEPTSATAISERR